MAPQVRALLRLTTSSNFVGSWIDSSAASSPLDAVDIACGAAEQIVDVGAVAEQSTGSANWLCSPTMAMPASAAILQVSSISVDVPTSKRKSSAKPAALLKIAKNGQFSLRGDCTAHALPQPGWVDLSSRTKRR